MDTIIPYPDKSFIDLDDGKSIDRIGRADKAVSLLTDSCVISSCRRSTTSVMWCPERRELQTTWCGNNWVTICVGQLSSLRENISTQKVWSAILPTSPISDDLTSATYDPARLHKTTLGSRSDSPSPGSLKQPRKIWRPNGSHQDGSTKMYPLNVASLLRKTDLTGKTFWGIIVFSL